ncbi:MAG: hypothetical protein ACR2GD_13185 [Pyrinomonadaceae bacterium]
MNMSKIKETVFSNYPIILFALFSLISLIVLPKDCSLFGNAEGPFCDAIPNNCCKDTGAYTLVAQVIFCIGIGLTIGTLVYSYKSQDLTKTYERPKLFE